MYIRSFWTSSFIATCHLTFFLKLWYLLIDDPRLCYCFRRFEKSSKAYWQLSAMHCNALILASGWSGPLKLHVPSRATFRLISSLMASWYSAAALSLSFRQQTVSLIRIPTARKSPTEKPNDMSISKTCERYTRRQRNRREILGTNSQRLCGFRADTERGLRFSDYILSPPLILPTTKTFGYKKRA